MRSLILDRVELPESVEARRMFLRGEFPELSEAEADDLSKVEPKKLQIYTQTIFSGERGVLANHFPITFALLKKYFDEDLNAFEFVRDLHAARPWKSYLTAGLTVGFVTYLRNDRPDILSVLPELPDAAQIEWLSLKTSRGLDPEGDPSQCLNLEELSQLTVGNLLELKAEFPPYVCTETFLYDVISYREEFRDLDFTLPDSRPVEKEIWAVSGRNLHQRVSWQNISQEIFEFIELQAHTPFTFSDFAEAAIDDFESDQEQIFIRFMQLVTSLMQKGVLIIRKP